MIIMSLNRFFFFNLLIDLLLIVAEVTSTCNETMYLYSYSYLYLYLSFEYRYLIHTALVRTKE